jgi:NTP pyrophosphatase (non-canonical NTP hydrolase)
MDKAKLMRIADEYGYEAQSRKLMEETAELTVALNKDWWMRRKHSPSDEELKKARENIIEEIADVEVVLSQIKYLMNCEVEVMQVKKQKIDRQLLRIEANKG